MRFEGVDENFVVKVLYKQLSQHGVGELHAIRMIISGISNTRTQFTNKQQQRRYDMSTLLLLTKWPPNFRMILICNFFSADDVLSSTTITKLFIKASTLHFLYRISIFLFINGEIAAPINHMKSANVPKVERFMKATGII